MPQKCAEAQLRIGSWYCDFFFEAVEPMRPATALARFKHRRNCALFSHFAPARPSHVKIPKPIDPSHPPGRVPDVKLFTKILKRLWADNNLSPAPELSTPSVSQRRIAALLPHPVLQRVISLEHENKPDCSQEILSVWLEYAGTTTPDQEKHVYAIIAGHALTATAKLQEWQEFQNILSVLSTYSVTSSYPYKRAIAILCEQLRFKAALKVIQRMQTRGLVVPSIFPPILYAAAAGGGPELVLKTLRIILHDITDTDPDSKNSKEQTTKERRSVGLSPHLFHEALRAIIETISPSAISSKDVKDEVKTADSIIRLMKHFNVTPNSITFTILGTRYTDW